MVYFERGDNINQAIFRDKQTKAGSRHKRLELINDFNPGWRDLSIQLFEQAT